VQNVGHGFAGTKRHVVLLRLHLHLRHLPAASPLECSIGYTIMYNAPIVKGVHFAGRFRFA
jgi:hypothetical protein